ncbi:uncharacterized protein LOC143286903 [Babylonia areolata]|uniref:uncharacterized protein LOC143286903 n=1 Tax=Babylonia areolata TaxID=304850 RepID=UPI003FD6BE7B
MLRRVLVMAAAPNSRGRIPRAGSQPQSKVGGGRHHSTQAMGRGRHVSGVEGKPPTGRSLLGHQTDRSLVGGVGKLSLQDSSASSSFRSGSGRRPFSSGRRPVSIKSVEDVATLLREELVRNVVVVVGAGISTPSGIPDFRSPGTGLYDNLQQYSIPYAEAIFDIDYFHHNPRPFFTLAKELYPKGKYRPNYLHYFAKLLHDRGLLLRIYTQNIDGLERIAGIPADKMVEAHGTFSTATCVTCRQKYNGEEIKERIMEDKLPRCRRTTCQGIVKPDIVFFGEELPKRFYFYLKDMLQADLVIIMGTSLEVQPFAGIIDTVRFTVPRLLFNRMAVGPFRRQKRPKDLVAAGDLIEQMQQFVTSVGWAQDMEDLITSREGYFKVAFPPPAPPASTSPTDKKGKQQLAKSDPLARMWRQNAQLNFYTDSDSSDTDSGVTPSDTDSTSSDSDQKEARVGGGGRGQVVGGKGAGKSSSSSTVSSSSSGCVSNASTRSVGPTAQDAKGGNSRSLLNRRGGGGREGGGQPLRSFSQQAVSKKDNGAGRKGLSLPMRGASDTARVAWGSQEVPKAPSVPLVGQKKPPLAKGKARQAAMAQRVPAPGTHPVKPRSSSVAKAVPEKAHSKDSVHLKAMYPRVNSAQPAKIAYRHRLQPTPYDARILALNADLSDSSSSDDQGRDEDSDDSSDDS